MSHEMRLLVLFYVVFSIVNESVGENQTLDEWGEFKKKYGKKYSSVDEELCRYELFSKNRQAIERNNIQNTWNNVNFQMKMNHFGDLDSSEVGKRRKDPCTSKLSTTPVPIQMFAKKPDNIRPDVKSMLERNGPCLSNQDLQVGALTCQYVNDDITCTIHHERKIT